MQFVLPRPTFLPRGHKDIKPRDQCTEYAHIETRTKAHAQIMEIADVVCWMGHAAAEQGKR